MTEDPEEGPDPNDLRRHAKRMFTEAQYRQKYRRIDFYKPNRKQLEFHNLTVREKMLRAGNQQGKTHCCGAEMTMHALALYFPWYTGRRYLVPPKIERPYDFIGWAGCTSQVKTRDGIQLKLLGPVSDAGGMGTGLIPLDNIVGKPTMSRGIPNFVDTITLNRETGGNAIIRLKTYEQGREGWQGEPVDIAWLDEDLGTDQGRQEIYGECVARLTTTNGQIIVSMTPVAGTTPMRRRFKERHEGTAEVNMGLDDTLVSAGGHIPDERLPELISQTKESERATRLYGADMQGEGTVFDPPWDAITHALDPAAMAPYWPWLWALDFKHGSGAGGHPFAAVLGAWDRDNDTIYVMHAIRYRGGLARDHVAAIKDHPMWDAPVAWPHDGNTSGAGVVSGETLQAVYKKLGLFMRPTHATFPDGGYNFEAGITDMENRLGAKPAPRLRFGRWMTEVRDEYQGYHRVNGLVRKVDDDLMSAIRVLCMDIRFAKGISEFGRFRRRDAGAPPPLADGVDFDLFTGQ